MAKPKAQWGLRTPPELQEWIDRVGYRDRSRDYEIAIDESNDLSQLERDIAKVQRLYDCKAEEIEELEEDLSNKEAQLESLGEKLEQLLDKLALRSDAVLGVHAVIQIRPASESDEKPGQFRIKRVKLLHVDSEWVDL